MVAVGDEDLVVCMSHERARSMFPLITTESPCTRKEGELSAIRRAKPSSKSAGEAFPNDEFTPGFGVWPLHAWRLHGDGMEIAWRLHGDYMEIAWGLLSMQSIHLVNVGSWYGWFVQASPFAASRPVAMSVLKRTCRG